MINVQVVLRGCFYSQNHTETGPCELCRICHPKRGVCPLSRSMYGIAVVDLDGKPPILSRPGTASPHRTLERLAFVTAADGKLRLLGPDELEMKSSTHGYKGTPESVVRCSLYGCHALFPRHICFKHYDIISSINTQCHASRARRVRRTKTMQLPLSDSSVPQEASSLDDMLLNLSLVQALDEPLVRQASEILDIIYRYSLDSPADKGSRPPEPGKLRFLAQVYEQVKAGQPIQMCLPAFPFKSPNTESKVLGRLPDMAEQFALAHLNGLCAAIGDVYPPGAELTIISDGLVYNGA